MKAKFLLISCGLLALISACNNSSESKTKETDTASAMATDTANAMRKDTVVMHAAIDSAAVTKEFLAAQEKNKKATPSKPKKQGQNQVEVYNEEPIPSHEALEHPDQSKSAPAAGVADTVHTKEYVYYIPSQKASYPGGTPALAAHIQKNMQYPDKALQFHVEGTVYAEVSLDNLGHVTGVEFPGTHLGYGLEEETEFLLKGTPRWIPAKENGQSVASKITVPVVYKITQ